MVRRIVAAGHEIGSHSMTHPKALGELPPAELRAEVETSKQLLEDASGSPVVGFRSPGFYVNDRVMNAVADAGYEYSSSVNSAVGYNIAKLLYAAAARLSAPSVRTTYHIEWPVLFAPGRPYRPEASCFWRAGSGSPLCELPVSMGFARLLPGITFAIDTMLPAGLRERFFQRLADRLDFANVVLHDFEFLEPGDFQPGTALPRTTAMLWKKPREAKRRQLMAMHRNGRETFGLLRDVARSMTLNGVADQHAGT
jgi:hypothetical protein